MFEGIESKEYYVCYFDILGQKNAMRSLYGKNAEVSGELQTQVDEIAEVLRHQCLKYRQIISELIGDLGHLLDGFVVDGGSNSSAADRALFVRRLKEVDWGVQQFSDSTVFYVEAGSRISATIFFQFVLKVVVAMPMLHSLDIGLRGSLGVGNAWKVEGGGLCGPILDEVDRLERSQAFYSRLVVSTRLVDKMRSDSELFDKCGKGDGGSSLLSKAFVRDNDGSWIVDPFSMVCMQYLRRDPDFPLYLAFCRRAKDRVDRQIGSLQEKALGCSNEQAEDVEEKAGILLKYQFLHYEYERVFRRFANEVSPGLEKRTDWPMTSVSNYYALYLQVDPLPMVNQLPRADERWCIPAGTTEMTVHMLRQIYQGLNAAVKQWIDHPKMTFESVYKGRVKSITESEVQDQCSRLHIGTQHLGRSIMVYVRDDEKMALPFVVYLLRCLSIAILPTFAGENLFSASVVYRRGWELFDNCLQGPVIWEAYNLCGKANAYPRIAVSNDFWNKIRGAGIIEQLIGGAGQSIEADIDGQRQWLYLSPITQKNFTHIGDQKLSFEKVYREAFYVIFRLRLMLGKFGTPTAESCKLARKLFFLEQHLAEYGRKLGLRSYEDDARAKAVKEVEDAKEVMYG